MKLTSQEASRLFERATTLRIAVLGDLCLDAYWDIDPTDREISVETGKETRSVTTQRYSPGGAGNLSANIAALGVPGVIALGVIGNDMFGRELLRVMDDAHLITAHVTVQDDYATPVYAKPRVNDREQERFDFGRRNSISRIAREGLRTAVTRLFPSFDCLVLNRQLPSDIFDETMMQLLVDLSSRSPSVRIIADLRDRWDEVPPWALRMSASDIRTSTKESPVDFAKRISSNRPVFVTMEERGIAVCYGGSVTMVPAVQSDSPIDPVGAGDTVTGVIAVALAGGTSIIEAAELATIAASITVRKLGTTGTATPAEIMEVIDRVAHG